MCCTVGKSAQGMKTTVEKIRFALHEPEYTGDEMANQGTVSEGERGERPDKGGRSQTSKKMQDTWLAASPISHPK